MLVFLLYLRCCCCCCCCWCGDGVIVMMMMMMMTTTTTTTMMIMMRIYLISLDNSCVGTRSRTGRRINTWTYFYLKPEIISPGQHNQRCQLITVFHSNDGSILLNFRDMTDWSSYLPASLGPTARSSAGWNTYINLTCESRDEYSFILLTVRYSMPSVMGEANLYMLFITRPPMSA